eukprot:147236-Hanusia_phi.AAC.1
MLTGSRGRRGQQGSEAARRRLRSSKGIATRAGSILSSDHPERCYRGCDDDNDGGGGVDVDVDDDDDDDA